jgi:hypothetical protein
MALIHFRDGGDWFNPNWVFRRFRADISEDVPEDVELRQEMEKAEAFGLLPLDSIDPLLASRILRAMRTVAEKTIDGRIPGWRGARPDDRDVQRMYLEAMSELLALLRRQPDGECAEIAPGGRTGP